MNIIITGAAGFIGMHVSKKLLDDGHNVIAIDRDNDVNNIAAKFKLKYKKRCQFH